MSGDSLVPIAQGTIRLLCVNDVYCDYPINRRGGYAELATLLKQYRRPDDPNTLFLVNGDVLGGSALAEMFHGDWVIELLNHLGTDAACIGNHEFDYGAPRLSELMQQSEFVWLGGNVKDTRTNELLAGARSTHVFDFTIPYIDDPTSSDTMPSLHPDVTGAAGSSDRGGEPIKLGMFGVCTQATPTLSWPGDTVRFEPVLACAEQQVEHLREVEKVDFIVGLTHTSLPEDKRLAEKLHGGVVALLGGHDHEPYGAIHNHTLVFKCGCNAYWLGIVDLHVVISLPRSALLLSQDGSGTFASASSNGSIDGDGTTSSLSGSVSRILQAQRTIQIFPSWQMVANVSVPPDLACKAIIDRAVERQKEEQAKENPHELLIPEMPTGLDSRTNMVRTRSTAITNMVADAMRARTDSDLAIINGGFVRGDKLYEAGSPLTKGDLLYELPFPKAVVKVRIQGRDLRMALEQHLLPVPAPTGRFPHPSSNVRILYNSHNEPLHRVLSVHINDEPLQDDRHYLLAISEFMFRGGDDLLGYTNATLLPCRTERICYAVCNFLASLRDAGTPYVPRLEHRIQDS